ncbi:Sas10 C-terminal domain-containing protein [Apiospora hydei]|uniref:Sas10 C-terminal domain-containing protein n=1 Tax=Apiospora hydei TaxID=1337664 RepID=A0ABR1V4G2_9PEZI
MARKRKASGPSAPKGPKELDPKDARINLEDLSESESWQGQDEITFDEAPSKKQKRQQEEEEFFEESEDALDYGEEEDSETDEETAELARLAKRMAKKGKKSKAAEAKEEEDEDMEGWGTSKKDYYGADQIDAETEALEEEAEAKRLQKKKRAKMTESDFIESEWLTAKDDEDQEDKDVVTEVLGDMEIPEDMSEHDRLRLLQSRYPELEPLAEELLALQPQLDQLRKDAEGQTGRSLPVIKYRVCGSYVATLGMYFALLTSPVRDSDGSSSKPLDPTELRDHEVMTFLLETREAWNNVKDLKPSKSASAIASIPSPPEEDAMVVDDAADVAVKPAKKEKKKSKKEKREAKEIEDSLADLDALITTKTKKPKKVKAAEKVAANDEDDRSDFGDEEALDEADAQEKAKRKKSLRFYTSQIVQKAQNRADRSRLAGGDDDVPIKERLRDRQARLNAEAIKRGTKSSKLGTNLGEGSDDEEKEVADSMRKDQDEEYYDMIAAKGSQNKAEKAARKEALANAGRADQVVEKEEIGEDGRRIITYQIEKNKGLTPHRKKDVRNPRLKKRLKYAKAQKKLKSMKATYSGGEARGGYGGEATGIKGNLIKSTKL